MIDIQNAETVANENTSDIPDNAKQQSATQDPPNNNILQYPIVAMSPFQYNRLYHTIPFGYPFPFSLFISSLTNPPIYTHNWPYSSNPSDVFINNIKLNNNTNTTPSEDNANNDIIYEKVNAQENISDALKETISNWSSAFKQMMCPPYETNPIFINAPTGYGKTTFVLNTLRHTAYDQGYYVLLIVNRSMLRGQIARIESQISLNYTLGTEDNPLAIYGNIIICTYQHFLRSFDSIEQEFNALPVIAKEGYDENFVKNSITQIGYIVMDEVHYFISDSTFSGNTQEVLRNIIRFSYKRLDKSLSNALLNHRLLPNVFTPTIRRIYMTATPDYVRDIIRYEERCAREVRSFLLDSLKYRTKPNGEQIVSDVQFSNMKAMIGKQITEYDFPKIKRDYKPCFYFSKTVLINKIIASQKNERWLIFVSSKDDGYSIRKDLKNKGIDAEFICTDCADTEESEYLEAVGRFECQVLISTSILDNGVSIIDDTLKNIAVDSVDSVQFLQMIGRKRLADGESVNIYVKNKTVDDIQGYWQSNKEVLKNISESYGDALAFENKINTDGFVGREFFKYNTSLGRHFPCDYAKYLLKRKNDELIRLCSNLSRDENAFAKLICEWLGLKFDDSIIASEDSPYLDYWSQVEDAIKIELQMSNIFGDLSSNADDISSSSTNGASLKELVKRADNKPFISKGRLQSLSDDILLIIKKIKQGSGIHTEKDEPMKSINSVLKFFANNGFDHYAFGGKYDSKEPNKSVYYIKYIERQDNN